MVLLESFLLAASLALSPGAPVSSAVRPGLPAGAVIVEERPVPPPARDRALVLWMLAPTRTPRPEPSEPYTCPEESRGHSLTGPTRLSLVDLRDGRVLNTIPLRDPHFEADSFTLPYRIHRGSLYRVDEVDGFGEGPPMLLDWRDLNGDGLAAELVLFDAVFCMGLETMLAGYSAKQDAVVQYEVVLHLRSPGGESIRTGPWVDYLFHQRPVSPGHFRYTIDYTGRGGCLDAYEVDYSPAGERFEGTLVQSDCGSP